jgi:hypothetical protein
MTGETYPACCLKVGDTYHVPGEDRVARVANIAEGLRFVLVEHDDGTAAHYGWLETLYVVDLAEVS